MKPQNTPQKTVAQLFVGCFSIAIIGSALAQMAQAQYIPPTQGAGSGSPSRTVGQGRGLIDTSCDGNCGECSTSAGTRGAYSDPSDPGRCVQCDGRV